MFKEKIIIEMKEVFKEIPFGIEHNDEIYFVVEELRKDFPDLSFTQMSDCAGVLILD